MSAPRKVLQSRRIHSVQSYDESSGDLKLRFANGQDYTFHGVPRQTVALLEGAQSPGTFFGKNIQGAFKHTKHDGGVE